MAKRTHSQIRKAILKILSDGKVHTFGDIERKVNTNWLTVRNHSTDLELFGAVSITKVGVKITRKGLTLFHKI